MRTLWVLEQCSVCFLEAVKGDEVATEIVKRAIAGEQLEMQLKAHPEVSEEE